MSYSQTDHHFMQMALEEAQQALLHGDFPVGAVLTIDSQFIAKNRNRIFSQQRTAAHAELPLLVEHSAQIRAATKAGQQIVLYSTLAPCLMCLGTTILHHIPKIIVACPDPYGGATHLDPHLLGDWYVQNWPVIETGLYRDESYALLLQFLQNGDGRWHKMCGLFTQMQAKWQDTA